MDDDDVKQPAENETADGTGTDEDMPPEGGDGIRDTLTQLAKESESETGEEAELGGEQEPPAAPAELDETKPPDAETPAPTTPEPPAEPETPAETPLEPLHHWDAPMRDAFAKLPDNATRQAMLDVYEGMERAHTERSQQIAPYMHFAQEAGDYIARQGVPAVDFMRTLVTTHAQLATGGNEQKVQTWLGLADAFGLDLKPLLGRYMNFDENGNPVPLPEDDLESGAGMARQRSAIDAAVAPVQQRLDEQQQLLRDHAARNLNAIHDRMKTAVGEDGKPLYPHLEAVTETMRTLGAHYPGEYMITEQEVAEIYNAAVMMTPALAEQVIRERIAAEQGARATGGNGAQTAPPAAQPAATTAQAPPTAASPANPAPSPVSMPAGGGPEPQREYKSDREALVAKLREHGM